MTKRRAGELERNRVISEVERYYRVKLLRVERRFKWLKDETGKNWWVLVGEEDPWHEIPKEFIMAERNAQTVGMIVVAVKKRTIIDVFAAPTGKIIRANKQKSGDYEFNLREKEKSLIIKEIPDMILKQIFSISYDNDDLEQDRKIIELKKIWTGASPEERREIARMLGAQPGGL